MSDRCWFDGIIGSHVRDAGWSGGGSRIRVEGGGGDTGEGAGKAIEASISSEKNCGQSSTMVWIGAR
jgi:hypothetical protein